MELTRRKHKSILAIIISIILTMLIYSYICLILLPKEVTDEGGTRYYRGMGFMAEPKNSIDIMVYGNSDVYSGFSPAILFSENFGYTSYASGAALQNIGQIKKLFDKTLQTQEPKVVILDVDCLYRKTWTEIDSTSFLFSPITFHSRWKDIKARDFYTIPKRTEAYDLTKGYVSSKDTFRVMDIDYMGQPDSKPHPIGQKNLNALNYIIMECKKRNIEIIFIELPSLTSWTYGKHNFINKIAEQNDIKFIDMNIPDDYKIDLDKDFRDNGNHLNNIRL